MADATAPPLAAQPAAELPRPVYLLASFDQRLRAHVIDTLIILVPVLGIWAVVLPPMVHGVVNDDRLAADIDSWDAETGEGPIGRLVFWALAFLLVMWLTVAIVRGIYESAFEGRTAGQTPGRRAVGIRVMRVDGQPYGFWWALYRTLLIRELLFGIGTILSGGLLWVIQYLWPLWDPQRRALHDVVARSRVVQDAEEA